MFLLCVLNKIRKSALNKVIRKIFWSNKNYVWCSVVSGNVPRRISSGSLYLLEYWRESLDLKYLVPFSWHYSIHSSQLVKEHKRWRLIPLDCTVQQSFLWWWTCSVNTSVLPNTVASSHVWQLSIWNVPCPLCDWETEF